jgi:hypothetical protein
VFVGFAVVLVCVLSVKLLAVVIVSEVKTPVKVLERVLVPPDSVAVPVSLKALSVILEVYVA